MEKDHSALAEAVIRARVFFWEYTRVVHGWEPRWHQRGWMSALQALSDGVLIHPEATQCPECIRLEAFFILTSGCGYEMGYRACPDCRTTNKLLICATPGSGKSDTAIEWVAWRIGQEAQRGIIPQCGYVCYGDDVAVLRSVAIRDTVALNKAYRAVFTKTNPQKGKGWGEKEWFLKRGDTSKKDPTLRGSGFSGTIQAYRFPSAIVVDDPDNPGEVSSLTYRNENWRVFNEVVLTRGVVGITPVVVLTNRHAEDDTPGRIMEADKGFYVIRTPALIEHETYIEGEKITTYGESVFPPQEAPDGTPVGFSTEEILQIRDRNERAFLTQYMVLPPSAKGDVFRFIREDNAPDPTKVARVIQFWDTATTQKTWSSATAMAEMWKLTNGRTYIAKVINKRMNSGEIMDVIAAEHDRVQKMFPHLHVWTILENAQGAPVYAEALRRSRGIRIGLHNIPGSGETLSFGKAARRGPADLASRALTVKDYVDNGIVYTPNHFEAWKDMVEAQLKAYTATASQTDIVAAIVGGIEYFYPVRGMGVPQLPYVMGKMIPRGT